MQTYLLRRLVLLVPNLFIVSLIVFFVIRLIPGDVIDLMVTQMGAGADVDRSALEARLGLDKPILVQYFLWIGDVLRGDFGESLWSGVPVSETIMQRLPVTLELGVMGLLIGLLVALFIGTISALRQDTFVDYFGRSLAIILIAVPSFWIGTLVIVFPAIWWGYSPSTMLVRFSEDPLANLAMFVIPAAILGMSMSGMTMRLMRTMMLDTLTQDYIRTAWAKGLSERLVVVRHAMKNALIPVVTVVGLQARVIIGGTVIVESIFSLPGIGRLLTTATSQRDYTLVSGVMLVFAACIIVLNLLVDLTYGWLDPRIQYD